MATPTDPDGRQGASPMLRQVFRDEKPPAKSVSSSARGHFGDRVSSRDADDVDRWVEREVLPRLLVAHADTKALRHAPGTALDSSRVPAAVARDFAPLVLEQEADDLLLQIESLLDRGVSIESVFVDLLAPTARKLGEYWEEDSCDFVDVTMGLWRLQEVMREISLRNPVPSARKDHMRSALFAAMPGDQHVFGTLMVEETFSRAGWDSEALVETQRQQLLQICSEHSFDLVGLTVTNDCHSGDLANLVAAIRGVSSRLGVKVILGGRAVQADPSLIENAGADGTAACADTALALADRLVPSPATAGYPVLKPGTPTPDAHT